MDLKKKARFVSKEDTNQFFVLKKKSSDLHLIMMQISFLIDKKFRSASNEGANQFLIWEIFRSASNEDAN